MDIYITSAFFLGAVHAIEPGHGKIILMTYLVGRGRKYLDALILASIATLIHTFSILILGIAAGVSAKYFIPDVAEHSMERLGGWFVLAVGVWMIYSIYKKKACHHSHIGEESKGKSYKQLVMLGIAGGIIPCPAALAVLSASVASGKAMNALLFIIVYGLGLEIALLTTGMLIVRASGLIERFLLSKTFENNARIGSAFLIAGLGLWLIIK